MKITTDPKKLTAALKAVRGFVCTDPTRNNILDVYVERTGLSARFTATDGHTLCSVEIPCSEVEGAPVLLTDDAIKILLLQAKGPLFQTADFDLPTDPLNPTFPDYQRVIPGKVTDLASTATMVHGFNAVYLARLGDVQKALKADTARIQLSADSNGPMRADIKSDLGEAVVIVMPMRLDHEPKKSKKVKAA